MSKIKVKICGIKTPEALEAAQNNGADFLGFVFCESSPRNIDMPTAKQLGALAKIPKVAVTVNASDELLANIIANLQPDYIQLHGDETDARAKEIKEKFGIKLIKALTPNTQHPTPQKIYDFLLFDSAGGGTGKQFDYLNFKAPQGIDWFLSGGLNAENVQDAIKTTGAKFVDVSSGVESQRGVKSSELIKQFLSKVHDIKRI